MVSIEVQVPQRVGGSAKKALEDFAAATKSEDVRSDFLQHSRA
jgi:DnaJ-class molecular chaperone